MDSLTGASGLQRRLTFAATATPIQCKAYLTGLLVAIDTEAHRRPELAGVLEAAGVPVTAHQHHGLTFPVSALYRVANLPGSVQVDVDPELEVLWQLAVLYGAGALDTPATLQVSAGRLVLRWDAPDGESLEGVLSAAAAGALLHSQLPFVASSDAWGHASQLTRMPLRAATLRIHSDGYVEIQALRPQQVESAPIPGLWKIGQTTYGAALPYADRLTGIDGLQWEQRPPTVPGDTLLPVEIAQLLDGHVEQGARQLAHLVSSWGSAVVAWPSGLGRRVAALSALLTVDSFPVQIVCSAWSVWSWISTLDALALGDSSSGDRVRIVTWADVAAGAALPATPGLILDDFTEPQALAAANALRRLDRVEGVNRVGVCAQWPQDPETLLRAMRLIRPAEFSGDSAGALLRYPLWPVRRANEHAQAYRVPLPSLAAGRPYRQRFDVRCVQLSRQQRRQLSELRDSVRAAETDEALVEQLRELTSAGSSRALSAKVSQAAGQVRQLVSLGRSVVVVARHRRTLQLLRQLVRPGARDRVQFLAWSELDTFEGARTAGSWDDVVVCDYPDAPAQLWQLVSPAGSTQRAAVYLWHAQGSVDDELAVSSARGVPATLERLVQGACDPYSEQLEQFEALTL